MVPVPHTAWHHITQSHYDDISSHSPAIRAGTHTPPPRPYLDQNQRHFSQSPNAGRAGEVHCSDTEERRGRIRSIFLLTRLTSKISLSFFFSFFVCRPNVFFTFPQIIHTPLFPLCPLTTNLPFLFLSFFSNLTLSPLFLHLLLIFPSLLLPRGEALFHSSLLWGHYGVAGPWSPLVRGRVLTTDRPPPFLITQLPLFPQWLNWAAVCMPRQH